MHVRLSLLMFLQYAIPGAWVPIFTLHLKELQFTAGETAWCCASAALACLVAPLIWGQIADRWLAAERCISLCSFACSILLWLVAQWQTPAGVFWTTLGFWCFLVPIMSLGTSLAFRHLANPEREFGLVRMWGTVGWISANLILGLWLSNPDWLAWMTAWLRPDQPPTELADSFRLGAILAALLAVYALTLPATPPSPTRLKTHDTLLGRLRQALEAPLLAARLLRQRGIAVLCLCLFGLYVTLPFSGQMTSLRLEQLGVARSWLPVVMTIGQSLEVVTLAILPILLLRLEEKGTMLTGILAWALAMTALALIEARGLVIASLGLHGIFISCFLVAGQVYVNRRAQKDVRASAQAMLQVINGLGMLIGHLLVGWIRGAMREDYAGAFAIAAVVAGTLVLAFGIGFSGSAAAAAPPE